MAVRARQLEIYRTASGDVPFESWLDELRDRQARARILVRLDRLEQGNFGDSRSVGGGIQELRLDFGPGYRVYFAEDGPLVVLLLLGGDKSTQSTDIHTAKAYWQDYRSRIS